jgi:hypothetical protein
MQDEEYQRHFHHNNDNRCENITTMNVDDDVNSAATTIFNNDRNKVIIQIDTSSLPTVEQIHNDNAMMFSSNATVRASNSGRRISNNVDILFDDDDDDDDIHSTFDDVYAKKIHHGDGIMKKKQSDIEENDNDCNNRTISSKLKTKYNSLRSRKCTLMTFIMITCIVALFIISIGLIITNRRANTKLLEDEHEYDNSNVDDVKKPNKTISSTFSKPEIGHIQQSSIDEKIAQIVHLVSIHTHTSTSHELATADTYQYHAVQWLSQYDTFVTTVPMNDEPYHFASWQYIQRYVIVALYYSLQGQNTWYNQYNFLSTNTSICDWNDGTTNGVFCNDNKEVISLILRTYK